MVGISSWRISIGADELGVGAIGLVVSRSVCWEGEVDFVDLCFWGYLLWCLAGWLRSEYVRSVTMDRALPFILEKASP